MVCSEIIFGHLSTDQEKSGILTKINGVIRRKDEFSVITGSLHISANPYLVILSSRIDNDEDLERPPNTGEAKA